MAQSRVLRGPDLKLYLGGKIYSEVQQINYTIDYGETEIYGVDSTFPQEIAPGKTSVTGTINGIRIKLSGGLQGYKLRSRIDEILYSPYVSLRIKDRHSDIDVLWLPEMKVTSESFSVSAKGIVTLSFNFKGIIPYNEVDLF